jgi:hypothetical protein
MSEVGRGRSPGPATGPGTGRGARTWLRRGSGSGGLAQGRKGPLTSNVCPSVRPRLAEK